MSTPRPLVAVPTYRVPRDSITGWTSNAYALPEGYVHALRRAGGTPVLVPGVGSEPSEDALEPFDALLLAGGGDVGPERYGAAPHPEIYGVDPARDEAELALYEAARRLGLPVLAICRGFQIVNVSAGGTLHQHLPELALSVQHGAPIVGTSSFHSVDVDTGSRLGGIAGRARVEQCLSHHHQGAASIGAGLRVVARSDDGLVEALEPEEDGAPWLVAVQWHPEMTAQEDLVQQALFDGLVAEASSGSVR